MKKVGVPRTPLSSADGDVVGDVAGQVVVVEVAQELLHVEVEPGGVADEVLQLELVLVGEEHVVHVPVAALPCRRLGAQRGQLGVRVDRQGQVAGDVAQPVAEVRAQLLADPAHARAEGALEVEVLDQRQRRVDRSGDVVALRVDRSAEVRREGRVALAEETGGEAEGEPAGEARQCGGHQDADACLVLQPRRLEGEADDQQRHREADAGERTAGQGVAQADALRQPPPAEAHARPRAGEDAEGLADDEAEHDAPHQP